MIAVAFVPACKKQSSDMTAPDAGSAESPSAPASDPLAELDQLEGQMRALGLQPSEKPADAGDAVGEASEYEDAEEKAGVPAEPQPEPVPTGAAVERDQRSQPSALESRCTTVCALNEAICELEVQICSMAKNHGSDPIYSDACERAVDDCELSGDACDTCVE